MSIAAILVPTTGATTDKIAIEAAILAAGIFDAHVQVQLITPDPRLAVPYMGMPLDPGVVDSIVESVEQLQREAAKQASAMLHGAAEAAGARISATPIEGDGVTCSLDHDIGLFGSCLQRRARLSDLVIFSGTTCRKLSDQNEAMAETLIHAERPVLLVPYAPATLTAKIIAAWDGGLASARALSAALPFLKHAGKAELLVCDPLPEDGLPAKAAQDYLAWHGVSCTVRRIKSSDLTVGEALLREATLGGASMLVMGGYGHHRLAEALFGGVTAHIRLHATLPVFLAH